MCNVSPHLSLIGRLLTHTSAFSHSDRAMPSVANFTLFLDRIKDRGTFSEGDTISGKVSLRLLKDTKVLSLSVKAKSDVNTKFKQTDSTFRRHLRVFKIKADLISADANTLLPSGSHLLNFTLPIPFEPLPSSFQSEYGSVTYSVEAKLSRRGKRARKVQHEINFCSRKTISSLSPGENRSLKVNNGRSKIQLRVDRSVFSPGDDISVVADLSNFSGRNLEPIFLLMRSDMFSSRRHQKTVVNCLQTEFKQVLRSSHTRRDQCVLKVPQDAGLTVAHCEALSVNFFVLVSLDALPCHLEAQSMVEIMDRDALSGAGRTPDVH
ncbi:hypothetical protein WMY93_004941 [Mugilogobius chulae]|uniref:Arrestin C-terminal-like domain-containing protein n=1 Tax=Mugilogobius chulae TaxID=88201 RepID=A0AAW0PPU0_9GOBI